jgi:hypothetical protein
MYEELYNGQGKKGRAMGWLEDRNDTHPFLLFSPASTKRRYADGASPISCGL